MDGGSIYVQTYLVINKEFHYVCEILMGQKVVREDDLLSKYPEIVVHIGNKVMRADGSVIPHVTIIQLANDGIMKKFLIDDNAFTKIRGGTSKGQASKAKVDGVWYKLTQGTFNAQAEVVASRLARFTNVGACAEYEMCIVNGEYATMSKDFLGDLKSETIASLHAKYTGKPIEPMLEKLSGDCLFEYVRDIVNESIRIDLQSPNMFRKLSLLLQFDALVLNDDRHFNNIAFVQQGDSWDFSVAFDFDCALFSCLEDLDDISSYTQPSQPFYSPHSEQLKWLDALAKDIKLTVQKFDVEDLVCGVWDDIHQIGKREIIEYLENVLKKTGGVQQ